MYKYKHTKKKGLKYSVSSENVIKNAFISVKMAVIFKIFVIL